MEEEGGKEELGVILCLVLSCTKVKRCQPKVFPSAWRNRKDERREGSTHPRRRRQARPRLATHRVLDYKARQGWQ